MLRKHPLSVQGKIHSNICLRNLRVLISVYLVEELSFRKNLVHFMKKYKNDQKIRNHRKSRIKEYDCNHIENYKNVEPQIA